MATKCPSKFTELLTSLKRKQQGAIAVITVICLIGLISMIALAVDVGRFFNLATDLQHAADAAALAGATQLDNSVGSMDRARVAAMGALVNNRQIFANDGDPDGNNVVIEAGDIVFLLNRFPRVVATGDADANFIEVLVSPRTVNYIFTGLIMNNGKASAQALAVAGLGVAICKIPPIMICNPNEDPGGGGSFDSLAEEGNGVILKAGGNGAAWVPGNFGLLALNNIILSVNQIRDAMGRVHPNAICFGDTVGTKPGQSTAVAQGFNVRFDIYEGPISGLTGDEEYQPSNNPVKGLVKMGPQCSFNAGGGNGWTHPVDKYDGPYDLTADAMGFPRDNCAYDLPNGPGGCTVTVGGRIGDGVWDVARYMDVNHSGVNWQLDMGATPTRYDVYRWERGDYGALGSIVNNAGGENAYPQCYAGPQPLGNYPDMPDRRVISVAVINCIEEGVIGATANVKVLEYIDIFLTEPMGVYDGNNDLYAEIIGPTAQGSLKKDIMRYITQLYK